jgi:hypothetical protein
VDLITRAIQPFLGRIADSNFAQTVAFVASLSRTAEVNSPGMQRLAARLVHLRPEVRQEFADISRRIGQRTAAARLGVLEELPLLARQPAMVEPPPRAAPSGTIFDLAK